VPPRSPVPRQQRASRAGKSGREGVLLISGEARRVCPSVTKPRKDQTAPAEQNGARRLVASAVANSRPKGKQDERKFMSKLLK